MGWPYHFIDLTDDQKHIRRELLDKYAWIAQLSVFLPLLAIQTVSFLSWLSGRSEDGAMPGSPRHKETQSGSQARIAKAKRLRRKLGWWLGEPLEMAGSYLGLREEVLVAGGWFGWLLVLCFPQTGEGTGYETRDEITTHLLT